MERLHRAAETDCVSNFRAREFPGVAESEPVLWIFVLPAILDRLPEQAVVIANAITMRGDLQCRHTFHEAGGEASEAAIAKRGIRLHLAQLVEIDIEAGQGLAELSGEAKIVERVHEQTPDQKFERQVVDAPPALFEIGLLGCDPGFDDPVAGDQRGRDEPIPLAGRSLVLACCADKPLKDKLAKTANLVAICFIVRAIRPFGEIRFSHAFRHVPFLIALNGRDRGHGVLRHPRCAPHCTPGSE